MKMLIIHLSNMHLSSDDDPVMLRVDAIVDAVKNVEYELDAIVLTVFQKGIYSFLKNACRALHWEIFLPAFSIHRNEPTP